MDNAVENRDKEQAEEVEIAQLIDIKRIQEALTFDAILHYRNDFSCPVKVDQHVNHEYCHQRINEHTLNGVGDDQRQSTTEADDGNGDKKADRHDQHKG